MNPSASSKRSLLIRILMWITGAVLAIILLGTLALMSFNAYLQSDEKKILDRLDIINDGSITFENAYVSIFKNFPNASLILNNVELIDEDGIEENTPILKTDELVVICSILNWRNKEVSFSRVQLSRGDLRIVSDVNGNSNLKNLFYKENPRKNRVADEGKINRNQKIWMDPDDFIIEISDMNVEVIDSTKTIRLHGLINHARIRPKVSSGQSDALVDLDLDIHGLTFKEKNGTYLKNTRLVGELQLKMIDQTIFVSPTDLLLNDQKVKFHGQFVLDESDAIILHIENQRTNMDAILPLLPNKISEEIRPYKIKDEFYTNGHIYLCPGDPALVDIEFRLPGNDVYIKDDLFKMASGRGRFVNRKYSDDRKWNEKSSPIHITLDQFEARYQDFELSTSHLNIYAPQKSSVRLSSTVMVDGPASSLSRWFNSDKFIFEQGQFRLNARINGPIDDIRDLLLESQADLQLFDSYLHYVPAGAHIPVPRLSVSKREGDASFSIHLSTLDQLQHIYLAGGISNISTLIKDVSHLSSHSQVKLNSEILSWNKLIDIFKKPDFSSERSDVSEGHARQSMKSTIVGIHNKVGPRISLSIDTFEYYEIIDLYNLKGKINCSDGQFLNLEEASFDLDQGRIDIECSIDITHPEETPFHIKMKGVDLDLAQILPAFDYFDIDLLANHEDLPSDLNLAIDISGRMNDISGLVANTMVGVVVFDAKNRDQISGSITSRPVQTESGIERLTQIELEGSPHVLNDYFNNKTYFFQDTGSFKTQILYQGDVKSIDQLIQSSKVDLNLSGAAVLHKDLDIVFPLNDVKVKLDHDSADFVLYMYSPELDRELHIDGHVNSATELIFGNTTNSLNTKVNVYSPIINLSHAKDVFATTPDTAVQVVKSIVDDKIKKLVLSLMNRFNPDLSIGLDTFIINDRVIMTDLATGCQIRDSVHFILDRTNFNFCDGQISLSASTDLSKRNEEPFEMELNSINLDLGQLIYALDYVNIPSLREADRVDGIINFDLTYQSSLVDLQLQGDKTKAIFDFELSELELSGVDVIDKLADKLRLNKLFRDIRFGPIANRVMVNGSRIDIPQMEIQSSSIDLFVEGHIDKNHRSNVWLSIPLDNLKYLRGRELKEKKGYAATRQKIFMELTSGDDEKMHARFRLRKKEFYKQRGMRKQFRLDKKRDRKIRRKMRKEARKKSREANSID